MKTIKFLQFAKYPVLILIAIFGIYMGCKDSPCGHLSSSIVGTVGSSQATPLGTNPLDYLPTVAIGGQRVPGTQTPPEVSDIGGETNQNKPQVPDPLGFSEMAALEDNAADLHRLRNFAATSFDIGGNQGNPQIPLPSLSQRECNNAKRIVTSSQSFALNTEGSRNVGMRPSACGVVVTRKMTVNRGAACCRYINSYSSLN